MSDGAGMRGPPSAVRTDVHLVSDPARVVARFFVPGQAETTSSESQASRVVDRVLHLSEHDVERSLAAITERFEARHPRLEELFSLHAERIANRLEADADLSEPRWLLLGATFTHEYSVEAAALCNPCFVEHPDQTEVPAGTMRLAMSVRGIGEGHRSSIGFRTGSVDTAGHVEIDVPTPHPVVAVAEPGPYDRELFHAQLRIIGEDGESAASVLDPLDGRFGIVELEERLGLLGIERDTRSNAAATIDRLRAISRATYTARVPSTATLSQTVLWPAHDGESHGMEDARFVRFTEDDGTTEYLGTYTAYDGVSVHQQLLRSDDLRTFWSTPLTGHAAANKGLALFPRRIGGRYAALSRADGETNAVAFSEDLRTWDRSTPLATAHSPYDVIQAGNCGAPIETPEGWLMLTHVVGPMRTYRIGALLLDLDDPTIVRGELHEPLLEPTPDEQDGYTPNVVYSCGAVAHEGLLVIPYGIADQDIGVATVDLASLLESILGGDRATVLAPRA